MAELSTGTFRTVLLTPSARLLDCRCGLLLLPGHDGIVGILRNHAPMLYKLGLGIMQVKNIAGRNDAFFVINGGFARVSENTVTVLAYEVVTFEGMDTDKVEQIASEARSVVVGKAYTKAHAEQVDVERSAFVAKMAQMMGI